MKALVLLIFIGVVFFGLSALTTIDVVVVDLPVQTGQIEESVLEEPDVVVLEKDEPKELEVEEEVVVVEKVVIVAEEVVVEAPEEVVIESPVVNPPAGGEEVPQISFSEINTSTREVLVNIFCTTKSGGSFKPITGSGVIIDERGVILTNAHVAQYFLIEDYLIKDFIECVIRVGSPAKPKYKATLVYISPSWIKENANGIRQQSPKGTGEDDYALLLITGRTNPNETLPETFSFIPPEYNSDKILVEDDVLLAAYPAGFLGGISIQRGLYISSAVTKVMELFTFASTTLDLFSIGGSVVAQQGSSGGAVVSDESKLLGIIVTSSVAEETSNRDLRAITIAHINRSFVRDAGTNLQTLLLGDVFAEAQAFNENIVPILTRFLEDELNK